MKPAPIDTTPAVFKQMSHGRRSHGRRAVLTQVIYKLVKPLLAPFRPGSGSSLLPTHRCWNRCIKCVFHTNVEELVGKLEDTLFEYQEVTAKSRNILEDIEESFDATTVGLPPRPGS